MKSEFYAGNRKRLVEKLRGGPIVLTAYTAQQQRGDTGFPFEQEANFWYLTGIEHADWRLVIDGGAQKSWLIAPEIDAVHDIFNGSLDMNTARQISGVTAVLDKAAGERLLEELAAKHTNAYTLGAAPYEKYVDFALNPAQKRLNREIKRLFGSVGDCRRELAQLRAIKQPAEIAAMEKAAAISVRAFQDVKAKLATFSHEYEIEAELTYYFRRHNAVHAFEPIVASGKNACTLHYVQNRAKVRSGQLLLIDAGARVDGYPADITRTYAAGEPSARHHAIHRAVQEAEQRIVAILKPGLELREYSEAADHIMKDALLKLGLIKDKHDETAYRRYFPHAVSHGLGIDVHDSLGGMPRLEPGMVLTVEPGIYIPEERIGVRIEDDVLITADGGRNLTAGLSTDS